MPRKTILLPRCTGKTARAPWTISLLMASTWPRALASRAHQRGMSQRRHLLWAKPCRYRRSSHHRGRHHPNRAQKKTRSAKRPPNWRRLPLRSKTKIRQRLKKLTMRTSTRSTPARQQSLRISMTWTSTTPSRSWLPSIAR